ncbi:NUDIX domain-containing protein [Candidatus Woesebacteria bacterium]|nr:NUDIX domain-containing protein [Candidatus Woesebacteria bacterium]
MGEKTQGQKSKVVREFSSGGVVFKKTPKGLLFLLIKPAESSRWQLPKGHIEERESSSETAVREVREEGGVEARIVKKIGDIKYFFVLDGKDVLRDKKRIFKVVNHYLLEFVKDLGNVPNSVEVEEVKFVNFEEAYKSLTFKNEKEILKKAKAILEASAS